MDMKRAGRDGLIEDWSAVFKGREGGTARAGAMGVYLSCCKSWDLRAIDRHCGVAKNTYALP